MKNFFKSLFGLGKKEKKEEDTKVTGKREERSERRPRPSATDAEGRRRPQRERRRPNRKPRTGEATSEARENVNRPEAEGTRPKARRKPRRKPRPANADSPSQEAANTSESGVANAKARKKPNRRPKSEGESKPTESRLPKRQSVVAQEEDSLVEKQKPAMPTTNAPKPSVVETPAEPVEPVFFDSFGLNENIVEGLAAMNFKEATPVQQQAIPYIMQNRDIIACAQTGTGKTAAFLLPIMHNILETDNTPHLDTIILAPTRELAQQIDHQLTGLAYFTGISNQSVYGGGTGQEFDREKKAFQSGANIVVATPGKLIQHLNLGYVNTSRLKHFVLDEADRMLDMGFYEDIMRIVSKLPKERQTLLFSATMPPKIRQLANKILVDPAEVNIAISKTAEGVHQTVYSVHDDQKLDLLAHILDREGLDSVIVFTSRKSSVRAIERALIDRKIGAKGISSDLEQKEREEVLREFRNRNMQVLVATDIMSRGIDIADLDMVINYDVPNDAEDYVHRVGRTARAKSTGEAITFVTPKEQRSFYQIESLIGRDVEKPTLPNGMEGAPAWMDPEEARRKGRSSGRSGGGGKEPRRSGGGGASNRRRNQPRSEGSGSEHKPRRRNNPRAPRREGGNESASDTTK